ncbi:MAG: NUDIX hydrolase [Rhizobiales bacterium]|nr:NUDIX hydrolase [Hyphomicrobiales bacterium]
MSSTRTYPERPLLAVSAAIWRDDQVLVVQRDKEPLAGFWSLPGGLVKTGETLGAAISRELDEETGIVADPKSVFDYVEAIYRDKDDRVKIHYVIAVFAGSWKSGTAIAASDARAVSWRKLSNLSDFEMTKGTPGMIAKSWEFRHRS